MAPSSSAEAPSAPLADYFWIAGVDGSEILDTFLKLGEEYSTNGAQAQPPSFSVTIEEDADAEEEDPSNTESWNEKRNSYNRLSRISNNDPRASMRSIGTESKFPGSNRSSMTIRAGAQSPNSSSLLGDFDFDKALVKFTSERDSFLTDLNLSAGVVIPNRSTPSPRPRPKTQKIVSEDVNPLKSGIGSVRRHMSFRDMSSMKRQPSLARQGESPHGPTLLVVLDFSNI